LVFRYSSDNAVGAFAAKFITAPDVVADHRFGPPLVDHQRAVVAGPRRIGFAAEQVEIGALDDGVRVRLRFVAPPHLDAQRGDPVVPAGRDAAGQQAAGKVAGVFGQAHHRAAEAGVGMDINLGATLDADGGDAVVEPAAVFKGQAGEVFERVPRIKH
jgi:hypothetical protein